IEDKYASYTFDLESGKQVTGVVLQENTQSVTIIENPLAKGSTPLVIKKADIAERKKSPTSMMPKGLLDRLTREEILDLLAFVVARGDPQHRLFRSDHANGHNHGH